MSVSILVVDDEPDVADLFRQRFRREARQGTYVMHFAASGKAALERLAEEIQPELIVILSDINMPGMDGLQLLAEVKRLHPDLPVMMVTAYGDDERPGRRTRRRRVHHQAGRFRSIEGPAAPAAHGSGLSAPTGQNGTSPDRHGRACPGHPRLCIRDEI
jgi:CheY-like chemotaxis protein